MPANPMVTQELPAAQLVGKRYLLRNLLGEGAMGTVYDASDLLTQQTVALKRVTLRQKEDGTPVRDWSAVRMILAQEFETLASLKHPHIVDVLDYGFDADGQPYFVMSRVHGRQDIVTAGQAADTPQRAQMIVQLLQALDYLHRRHLVHRDVKPLNVLVHGDHQIKLVDFGLAVGVGQQVEIGGTLGYMAPETLLHSEVTPASDLYAVGLIAYQIFTGKYPFQLEDNPELLHDMLHTPPDVSVLPEPLGAVLSKLLVKDPAQRYQHATEVIHDLCTALDVPVPTETVAMRDSYLKAARFVGRTVELAQLSGALSSAIDGRGSSWLIGGMSGIGKSRLLHELRTFALVWGVQTLRGGASPDGEQPYECWRAPLRQLALSTELSDVEASILQQIVPDLSDVLNRRIPPTSSLSSAAEQQRLLWTVQAMFKRQADPVLLILEDLHWGQGGIDLLKRLIDLTQDRPLMIVASYRNDERPDLAEELPAMRHLALERLTDDEIVELSEAILGEPGRNPAVLALLERETEGNAFFMIETLRALADQAGDLAAVAAMELPERMFPAGIQAIIERRLTALPLDFHPLLRIAAVAGRQIDPRILQHIDPVIKLDYWFNACADVQILTFRDQRWWFAHDKLRDGILHGLAPDYVVRLHRLVAQAIESVYHYQLTDRARELMYHW